MNIQKIKVTNVNNVQPVKVNNAQTIVINMDLQEKTVIPTKEQQIIGPDFNYDALSKVTIDPIPNEYIIPTGNLDINANGDYDVTENASVKVKVQPKLQDKEARVTAPINTFIHPDEGYDGLGYVNVIATVDTENVEVTPTKEIQTINRSEDKYISSVTVNPIPEDYIIPSGELEITENGSYDVKDKASVKVETSGVDINEYFNTKPDTFTSTGSAPFLQKEYILKFPNLVIPDNVTKLSYLFGGTNSTSGYMYPIAPKIIFNNNVTNMQYAFRNIQSNVLLDLSGVNTENVTDMSYCFAHSDGLISLDLTSFNTSKVETMYYMFNGCSKLTSLDLSSFDTSNVTTMREMFSNCSKLTSLDLSSFNTSNVTTMQTMFNNLKLTSLDLSNFVTTSLTSTYQMFINCTKLIHIDIRNFDFSKVTSSGDMFGSNAVSGVPDDCLIIVKDDTAKEWITSKFSRLTNVKTVAELGE